MCVLVTVRGFFTNEDHRTVIPIVLLWYSDSFAVGYEMPLTTSYKIRWFRAQKKVQIREKL